MTIELQLKKGKKHFLGDSRDLSPANIGLTLGDVELPDGDFGNYPLLFSQEKPSPSMFYDFSFPLGMFGNDKYGCCVPAFFAGGETLDSEEGEHRVREFNEKVVLQGYSEVTGFQIADPRTDQGTEIRAYLKFHQKTGIPDAGGERDKIGLFAQLSRGNVEDVLKGVSVFGKSPIGFLVPNYAMSQFNSKEPFDVKKNASRQEAEIDGGHCVGILGTYGEYLVVRTWGTLALMTKAFFEKFCDESWIYFSSMFLNDGKTISGYDKEKGLQVIQSLS